MTPAGEVAGEQTPGETSTDDGDLVATLSRSRRHPEDPSDQRARRSPAVVIGGVQRHRGEADDVRLARVDDDAVFVTKSISDRPSRGDPQRELGAASLRIAWGDDLAADLAEESFQ